MVCLVMYNTKNRSDINLTNNTAIRSGFPMVLLKIVIRNTPNLDLKSFD